MRAQGDSAGKLLFSSLVASAAKRLRGQVQRKETHVSRANSDCFLQVRSRRREGNEIAATRSDRLQSLGSLSGSLAMLVTFSARYDKISGGQVLRLVPLCNVALSSFLAAVALGAQQTASLKCAHRVFGMWRGTSRDNTAPSCDEAAGLDMRPAASTRLWHCTGLLRRNIPPPCSVCQSAQVGFFLDPCKERPETSDYEPSHTGKALQRPRRRIEGSVTHGFLAILTRTITFPAGQVPSLGDRPITCPSRTQASTEFERNTKPPRQLLFSGYYNSYRLFSG
jgi:hypothetical protein